MNSDSDSPAVPPPSGTNGCALTHTPVFFYGLFMDMALLARKGVSAREPKKARLDGYRLSIGKRATLLPARERSVYGILAHVPASDLERLYSDVSVRDYRAQIVRLSLNGGQAVEAACYVLPPLPGVVAEGDGHYASELYDLAARLGLPQEYLEQIRECGAQRAHSA